MKNQTRGIILGILATVIVGGIILFAWQSTQKSTATVQKEWSASALEAGETFFDFGTISMAAGGVRNSFAVRNAGAEPVTITKITTSCMCTKATLKSGGRSFGPFGMPGHGAVPSIRQEIMPGETAEIEAVFDPAAHGPSGTGKIRRIVTVETNSQTKPKLEFSFAADVTP
ncbi:DUF1573 domain-containing protein [Candidatus Azambacteria bacterium]|nr:DUF1573 domain-containing protein [Candidatus Azambacteria bacterium]